MTVFGYVVLISIAFYEFISPFSPSFKFRLRRHQTLRQCLTTFLNTSKLRYATRRVFNSLLGVWKSGQIRSFVFDILREIFASFRQFKWHA